MISCGIIFLFLPPSLSKLIEYKALTQLQGKLRSEFLGGSLKVQQVYDCSLLESIEEAESAMIKEYNFPAIFQNVLGNVIPNHLLQRIGESYFQGGHHLSEEHSIDKTSESSEQPTNTNIFWVKSKKKKLLRRTTCTKTMDFLTYRPPHNKENNQINNQSKFSNFLRKKSAQIEEDIPNSEEDCLKMKTKGIIQQIKKDLAVNIGLTPRKNFRQSKRNFLRIRTSIDSPIFEDGILEENEDDILRQMNEQASNLSSSINPFQSQRKEEDLISQDNNNSVRKTRKNIEKSTFKSIVDQNKSNRSFKESENRKRTVFFAENTSSPVNTIKVKKRLNTDKKGTIFSKYSRGGSTNRSKLNKQIKRVDQYDDGASSKNSKWTGKSVVSIKFEDDEDRALRSKKSLRSNESILNSELNIIFKQRNKNRARTVKFTRTKIKTTEKKQYKSLKILEEEDKKYSKKSILKKPSLSRSKKSLHSQKSLTESKKKILFKMRQKGSRVSLLRKRESYLLEDDIYGQSFKSLYTLKDALRKNQSHKTFKGNLRNSIDNSNVYNQLNNFIKFFHDAQSVQGEEQIKRTFTKPIIIPQETHYKDKNLNRESLESENLCIDMGLRLVRKMNKLQQKKI